ncbi:thiamine pyrophosphate-dependent enzyme [Streptomyces sp. NPDC001633]|uniref:thiamine pyrophosphate-dependent enzyme n=1 Tax=Streptomyces sp. NPDC001633 TaxID=3364595 RepID=UPI0036AA0AC5
MDAPPLPRLRTGHLTGFPWLVHHGLRTTGSHHTAKLARPDRHVLALRGDDSFLMTSQEMETAVRESIPLAVLVLVDQE